MRHRDSTALSLLIVIAALSWPTISFSQAAMSFETPRPPAVLRKLSRPKYPPFARDHGISGDVWIDLKLRKDGRVESGEAVLGDRLLRPAALKSAQKSRFICQECREGTIYRLKYSFLIGSIADGCKGTIETEVKAEQSRVLVWALFGCIADTF
jgi:hypothetical protein